MEYEIISIFQDIDGFKNTPLAKVICKESWSFRDGDIFHVKNDASNNFRNMFLVPFDCFCDQIIPRNFLIFLIFDVLMKFSSN